MPSMQEPKNQRIKSCSFLKDKPKKRAKFLVIVMCFFDLKLRLNLHGSKKHPTIEIDSNLVYSIVCSKTEVCP